MSHIAEASGSATSDINELFKIAIQWANDSFNPFGTLVSVTDAAVVGPAAILTFERSFIGTDIASRFVESDLGFGWDHNWNWKLDVEDNGNVKLAGPHGIWRSFQVDGRREGTFLASPGDFSSLRLYANGEYTLAIAIDEVLSNAVKYSFANNDVEVKYSNNIYRNNSIFNVWLARSESLQRLNLKQSPLMGFTFKIESKIRENNTVHKFRKNETHMERLKRFIREEHYWKLFRWLQCVEYHQEAKCEVVKLVIDKLHEKTPVEGGMDEFWKAFSAWKDNGQPF